MADCDAVVTHVLSYVQLWTRARVWPVEPRICAARLGARVEYLDDDDQERYANRVFHGLTGDEVVLMPLAWAPFVPIDMVLATACAQRAVRLAGCDPRDYELVASVCRALTDLFPEPAMLDWMIKVAVYCRRAA